jgi:hypothetical protein
MLVRPVSRAVRRRPRKAVAIALFALKHQRGLRAVTGATQRASQSAATARQVAANPKARKQTRLALSAMALASERAREVGLTNAAHDRRFASHLRHAREHASKAITFAQRATRKRRTLRKTATITIGAGALGGAAYAGWKMYGNPRSQTPPSSSPSQVQPDNAPPAAPAGDLDRSQAGGETDAEGDDVTRRDEQR